MLHAKSTSASAAAQHEVALERCAAAPQAPDCRTSRRHPARGRASEGRVVAPWLPRSRLIEHDVHVERAAPRLGELHGAVLPAAYGSQP